MLKKKFLSVLLVIVILLCSMPMNKNTLNLFTIKVHAAYENTYTNTGNYRSDIIGVAKTQLGYTEGSNNDNKYGAYFNHNYVSWCAYFVSWCARQANVPTSVLKTSSRAGHGSSCFNIPVVNHTGACSEQSGCDTNLNYIPNPGDLFFTKSWSHVGLVYYVDGDYFYTIEGNSNNSGSDNGIGVFSLRRKISDYYFGVPNYGDSSHKIDSNYSKNYTAYLKNPSGKTTVYSSCGVVASGHYISGDDPVTIHEVYTDGCCKVSYTTDSGTTRTYYAKISDFIPEHTHSYTKYYESAHPHKEYNKCSCGDWYYTDTYTTVRSCSSCWDIEFASSKSSISLYGGNSATLTVFITGSVFPDGGKYDWKYDETIISVEKSDSKNYIITGLRQGSTNLVFTAYTDATLSTVITSLAIPVTVNSENYKIYYYANGGANAPGTQTKTYGNDIIISLDEPTRTGYTFLGWSTDSNAATPDRNYDPGDTYSENKATLSLYAVWKKTFYGDIDNNGVVNNTDVTKLSTILTGAASANSLAKLKGDLNGDGELTDTDLLILSQFCKKIIDTFPVEDMFLLAEFSLTKNTYAPGETIEATDFTVYYTNYEYHRVDTGFTISPTVASGSGQQRVTATLGDWSEYVYITVSAPAAYTLTYNANGGSGAPTSQTGATAYTISAVKPTRTGYTFLGWSKSSSATSATYNAGDSISLTANTTLYAVWKINEKTISSISVTSKPTKTAYSVGESLNTAGLKLKVTYSDGTYETVSSGFTTSGFSSTSAGTKTVTVSYGGKSTTFTVTVTANSGSAIYTMTSVSGRPGENVTVYVAIANNPGIISLRNSISYDSSALELTKVENTGLLNGYTTPSSTISSPYTLRWADSLATENNTANGNIVKLTFKIKATADDGDYSISVAPTEARNVDGTKVSFASATAKVTVINLIPGDIDEDGEVTDWDAIVLNRYLAGWDVTVDPQAADVDKDGDVSDWDAIVLERYLAGWNVTLQ